MATSTDGYSLLKTITLPGGVGGHGDWVTYDADTRTIWLAQSPDNNVVVIDTATNTVKATIPNIGNANGIALTPQYAFVADVTNNMIDVIDKRTFQVVSRVPVTGTTPDSVTYISSTNQVAVASDDDNVENFINATPPFAQTQSVQLTPNPASAGPDVSTYVPTKDLLYQPDDNQVDVINPHTGAIVTTWPLLKTGSVKPLVYDPVTNHFLAGTTNNEMLVLDGDSGAVLKTIPISGSVDETAIDVAARRAFVGDKAGVVDIINLDSSERVGGLPAEKNMHTLAVDPTTHEVYVYENNCNTVDVYAPGPQAPDFASAAVNAAAQPIVAAVQAAIAAGTAQVAYPDPSGTIPPVVSGSGGVLIAQTGGQVLSLPNSYTDAFLMGSTPDVVFEAGTGQSIVSGAGGSTLVLAGSKSTVIASGDNIIFDQGDSNAITLDNGANTVVESGTNATVTGGTGNNIIGINPSAGAAGGTTLVISAGHDTILASSGNMTVDASTSSSSASELVGVFGGRLTFVGGAGSATVGGGSAGSAYVRGGSGSLIASGGKEGSNLLVGGTGDATLFGGGNGDVLVAGLGSNILVAGSGNETLTGAFPGYVTSGNNVFFSGSGNAAITTGNGNDTVFAGSGTSTVTLGAGADLVAIVNGGAGGNIVINGFDAAQGDRITLQGYGADAAANAVNSATTQGGSGSAITLADGTKVTFTGVTSLDGNSFV